jgi:predicted ATPase
VFSRDAELAALERFLDDLPTAPAAVVIEGEAGIGKTTLWLAGTRMAEQRGLRVLQAQPAESEAQLSYAALTDLVAPVFAETRELIPPPQERALAAAILQADADEAIDDRTTATAVLSVLTALVAKQKLLVAIDDVQWLDPASERALAFALRRAPAGVGMLLAQRSGSGAGLAADLEHERVTPGPLSLAALHHLITAHLGRAPARPLLVTLAASAGGNPFFAVELARALTAEHGQRMLSDPLPLPQSLHDIVAARVLRLSETARRVLSAAAALSRPTVATLLEALGPNIDVHSGLSEAEDAKVVELDRERIRFTHPLLASVVYASLTAERRRTLHRRLADVVSDREERARHLARSATTADEAVAAELEQSGSAAARRGAQHAAAELFEQACRLTPEDRGAQLARRVLAHGTALFAIGDVEDARERAEYALELADGATMRASALSLAASTDWAAGDAMRAVRRLEEALAPPDLGRELRAELTAKLARFGVVDDPRRAARHARAATELLSEEQAPELVAGALIDRFFAAVLLGQGADDELLRRALELEVRRARAERHPIPMVWFHFTDAFEDARARYALEAAAAR